MKIVTNDKFWVSEFFTVAFGSVDITPAKSVPSFKRLERSMTDKEIFTEPGAQESSLGDVAAFLETPLRGTDDGNWNIFYVGDLVVSVLWYAPLGHWYVHAWRRSGLDWRAGDRVFFGNKKSKLMNLDSESLPSELVINGITYKRV